MKTKTKVLTALALAFLGVSAAAWAERDPVLDVGQVQGAQTVGSQFKARPVVAGSVSPDGGVVANKSTASGVPMVEMVYETADGGIVAPLRDGDKRTVVAVGAMPGPSIGADLTTAAAAGPTIPAGAEYLICAMTDLWLRFDGQAATADVPSLPWFARTCRLVGPFAVATATSGILPAGATILAGKEVVAIPMTRPQ